MTGAELAKHLKGAKRQAISPAALISYHGAIGVAYVIGENWGGDWRSGEIVCLWNDGERTVLPEGKIEVIRFDLWAVKGVR